MAVAINEAMKLYFSSLVKLELTSKMIFEAMNLKHVALLNLGHYICKVLLIDQFLLAYHIMSVINIKTY